MKRFLLLLFPLITFYSSANAQTYWGNLVKASVDNYKNITLVGCMQDSMVFRNAVIHSSAFIYPERYLAQLDSNYNLKWCKILYGQIGEGEFPDMGVVNDSSGNIYIGGPYRPTWGGGLYLDSTTSISSYPYAETIFLAKYDTLGNLIWYRKNRWGSNTTKFNLGIDSLDNIYLSSIGIDTVSFGADTLVLTDTGAFVAKFDTAGNNLWISELRGAKSVCDFQTDPTGNSFVVGNCSDTQYCGTDTLYAAGNNSYIIKCDSSGTPEWQHILRGGTNIVGCSIGVGANGRPSFVGTFEDSVRFNTLPALFTPTSTVNMFLANYTGTGVENWAIKGAPFMYHSPFMHQVRADRNNDFYVSCEPMATPLLLDTTSIPFPSPTFGNSTALVIKLDSSHNVLCKIALQNVTLPDMSFDEDNYVYLVGKGSVNWQHPFIINGDTILSVPYPTYSPRYIYIAKFDEMCHLLHTERIISPWFALEDVPDIAKNIIKVYPVPTTDLLNISEVVDKSHYRLINIAGTSQMQGTIAKGDNTISIGHLPPGMYYLQVISEDGSRKQVARIVKL